MTEAQTTIDRQRGNFLVAGFRELGRRFSRLTLRRKIRHQGAERDVALTALGQRAWEERIDLTAFAELRNQLAGLEARGGEISKTTSSLESGKASLEQERRSELEKFADRQRAVEGKKSPIDTALRQSRSRRTQCEQTIGQADARLARIPGELATLEQETTTPGPAAGPDQGTLQAAQERHSRLASEQIDLGAKLAAARGELPGLIAEENRLTGESQQYASQIAVIDAEEKAALAHIDGEVSRLRSELGGATQQANAVQKERAESFGRLGQVLYDSGVCAPALVEQVARVATIDRARADTEAALDGSLTLTRALSRGTMVSFWGVLIGIPLLLAALVGGTNYYLNVREAARVAAESAAGDLETAKTELVRQFVQSGAGGDPKLRADAVRILKDDIPTMGATANPRYLPILTKILRSDEADLRSAAADAIGMIGPTAEEIPELTRLLNDPVAGVAAAARRALASRSDSAR